MLFICSFDAGVREFDYPCEDYQHRSVDLDAEEECSPVGPADAAVAVADNSVVGQVTFVRCSVAESDKPKPASIAVSNDSPASGELVAQFFRLASQLGRSKKYLEHIFFLVILCLSP